MHHFRSTRRHYDKHRVSDNTRGVCSFCADKTIPARTLKESETMYLVTIRTKYDVFEGRPVLDHLMVIPKRHTESLSDFTKAEKLEQMTIIGEYEVKGYDVYARSVTSVDRSVAHQHTHLIKMAEKKMKYFVHLKKPYILFNG